MKVAMADDSENGKQQYMRELVELALCTAWIRNVRQNVEQGRQRGHGNLRFGCRPMSQTFAGLRIRFRLSPLTLLWSVTNRTQSNQDSSIEQPWHPTIPCGFLDRSNVVWPNVTVHLARLFRTFMYGVKSASGTAKPASFIRRAMKRRVLPALRACSVMISASSSVIFRLS